MKYTLLFIFFFIATTMRAQVPNDECLFATFLGNVDNYCSGTAEFDNTDATASSEPIPFCWFGGSQNDLWYTFTPTAPSVYIQMSGATLNTPSIAVYDGNCGALNEVGCASKNNDDIVELNIEDLIIGQVYYLRVDAEEGRTGTFQLCLRSYFPIPKPEADCVDAVILCDKSPFQVENLQTTGNVQNELTGSCVGLGQDAESGSVWYKWTCKDPGTLTFTLTPNNPNTSEEDLDFVVYEFPGGLDDCDNRESVRCMLSGRTGGFSEAQNAPCVGPTGLREGETDFQEFAGCNDNSNNFVAPLDMEAGKSYGLIVNNFSNSGFGFSIEFGGTGTFLGPDADFFTEAVDAFECDKTINFINNSSSETDPIVSYQWNFGSGSQPSTATGEGPHSTIYNSFGDKVAALTVESSRGCLVTKVVDLYVEACCQDTSTLSVSAEVQDVQCPGDENGTILGDGTSGSPAYQYSLDGSPFQPNPFYNELAVGNYDLTIIDIKGCRDSILLEIIEPTQTTVDAGQDFLIEWCEIVSVDAEVSSDYSIIDISWVPADSSLNCADCLNPEIMTLDNQTYIITVTDENGCTASDEMSITVNKVRDVFWPNIISANEDNNNDYFNLFGIVGVKNIEYIKIFDRWGNMVYNDAPEINNYQDGWDGRFGNTFVEQGVYVFIAEVRFKDDEVFLYKGDVTVLR